jgi:hypothetical protein
MQAVAERFGGDYDGWDLMYRTPGSLLPPERDPIFGSHGRPIRFRDAIASRTSPQGALRNTRPRGSRWGMFDWSLALSRESDFGRRHVGFG